MEGSSEMEHSALPMRLCRGNEHNSVQREEKPRGRSGKSPQIHKRLLWKGMAFVFPPAGKKVGLEPQQRRYM